MANNSFTLNTWSSKRVIGDNSSANPEGALLQVGVGRQDASPSGDTWLFYDNLGGSSSYWGIKHNQGNNDIGFYGAGALGARIHLNGGNSYIKGNLGIGIEPSYKLHVNGNSYLAGHLYAKSDNDFVSHGNEVNFIPDAYSGSIYFNYDSISRTSNSNITSYIFANGKRETLAIITKGQFSGNAATATELQTARTIWGQSFNGSSNISGNIVGAGPSIFLPSNSSTFNFLTSGSGAGNGLFGRIGLADNYSTIDISTYRFDMINGKARIVDNSSSALGINTSNYLIGKTTRNLHFNFPHGSGGGVNDGTAMGITWGHDNSAQAGIYVQSSGSYGTKIYFATTDSYANGAYARMILTHDGKLGVGTISPSYKLHVTGDIYANGGWLRTSGNTGWYSESYGGGWYMTDTTWIRTYNGKNVYQNTGIMRTDGQFQVGDSGNRFYANSSGNGYFSNTLGIRGTNTGYNFYVNGSSKFNGYVYAENRTRFVNNTGVLTGMPPTNVLALKNAGYGLYYDEEFASGNNSVSVYNNSGNGTVTITRMADSSCANSSGYVLKIQHTGTASPGWGGFYQGIQSRANAVFVQIFRAKIPTGYQVITASNSMGNSYSDFWITEQAGTGKWEWYARVVLCGSTGTFSTGGHVYLTGGSTPSSSAPIVWYLSNCNCYDLTKGAYLSATRIYGAVWNDYAEYRSSLEQPSAGHIVQDNDDGNMTLTQKRLIPGAQVVSDTFGFAIGETEKSKIPIAVSGRALVYTYQNRSNYHAGMAVCSAPGGTVDIMTREEIKEYSDCIIGIVSEIPEYETWGTGNVKVDNRIWIRIR